VRVGLFVGVIVDGTMCNTLPIHTHEHMVCVRIAMYKSVPLASLDIYIVPQSVCMSVLHLCLSHGKKSLKMTNVLYRNYT